MAAIGKNVKLVNFGVSFDFAQIHIKRCLPRPEHTHTLSGRHTQPFGGYRQKRITHKRKNVKLTDFGDFSDVAQLHSKRCLPRPDHTTKYLGSTLNRLAAIDKNVKLANFGVSSDFAQIYSKRCLPRPDHTHQISRRHTQPFGCYRQKC